MKITINTSALELHAQEKIKELLSKVQGINFALDPSPGREFDFIVHLNIGTQPQIGARHYAFQCDVKANWTPNDILKASSRARRDEGQSLVLIGPRFSPQAIDLCTTLRIHWLDLAGNASIDLPGIYIHVIGNENPHKLAVSESALYTPASSRILYSLLNQPHREWQTGDLAFASQTSYGQVSKTRKLLKENAWIESEYGLIKLIEPINLLLDWARHYEPRREALHYFSLESPSKVEQDIVTNYQTLHEFTEFSAAAKYSAYARQQRVSAYVSNWDPQTLPYLKLGNETPNVTIYPLRSLEELPLYCGLDDGFVLASPILTYLDLTKLGGRGQDAAEHLLANVIEPRWR